MRTLLMTLAVLLGTTSMAVSQNSARPARVPAQPRVVETVRLNARPVGPVRIVRVPGVAPDGITRDTDGLTNWMYFSRGGYARSRAAAAQWRSRFRTTTPYAWRGTAVYSSYAWRGPAVYRRW
ncbi:MAG: hypothetical protein IPM29_16155 [Planctomycetes bacterium]|nr:hypothetical protein [Planctomycetota bacterium]